MRERRLQRGWRHVDLAREAGLAAATVGKVENGRPVKWETTARVATALGIEPKVLFDEAPSCYFCAKPAEDDHHHPLPKSRGGTATIPACGQCDFALQAHDAAEYGHCERCGALRRPGCTPSYCGRCQRRHDFGLADPGWTFDGKRWHHDQPTTANTAGS